MIEDDLLKCRKCGKELAYLGSAQWGCGDCNYECNYDIVYFYNLGKQNALSQQSVQNQSHQKSIARSRHDASSGDTLSQKEVQPNSHHEKHGDSLTQQWRRGIESEEGKVSNSNESASDDTLLQQSEMERKDE